MWDHCSHPAAATDQFKFIGWATRFPVVQGQRCDAETLTSMLAKHVKFASWRMQSSSSGFPDTAEKVMSLEAFPATSMPGPTPTQPPAPSTLLVFLDVHSAMMHKGLALSSPVPPNVPKRIHPLVGMQFTSEERDHKSALKPFRIPRLSAWKHPHLFCRGFRNLDTGSIPCVSHPKSRGMKMREGARSRGVPR